MCGLGTYSATSGMSSCVSCGAGKYLTTEGNDEEADCELCGTGTYSAQQGQTSAATCVACPAGKYAATLGMSSCTLCGAGKYLTTQGSMEKRIASCAALAPTPLSKGSRRQQRVWTAASANTPHAAGASSEATCTYCGVGKYSAAIGRKRVPAVRDGQVQ